MTIGTIFTIIAIVVFFCGTVVAMIFDSKLTVEDYYINKLSNAQFSRFCIGVDIGIILMIAGIPLLIAGVIINLMM